MVKILSPEHRAHLSESVKRWWTINKLQRPDVIIERGRRMSEGKCGKPSALKGVPTGISPPNKGIRTGRNVTCKFCQKEFYVMPRVRRTYCSRVCFRNGLQRGWDWHELHPTINWHMRTLTKSIGKCEECGFNDMRILVVHHIDRNRENGRRENLRVLCPNCHFRQHLDNNGKPRLRKNYERVVVEGKTW